MCSPSSISASAAVKNSVYGLPGCDGISPSVIVDGISFASG
jgi:hypothetical protein